jgi:NifU-like protein
MLTLHFAGKFLLSKTMPYYPQSIRARAYSPEYVGTAAKANAVGTDASFECGCFVRMSLAIDKASKTILNARFLSNGCGYMIAAADKLAEVIVGSELTELHSIDEAEYTGLITKELGAFPRPRCHCLHTVLAAFRSALADHRAYLIEEFRGEKPLICTCFGIAEESIEEFIISNQPHSVDEVTRECRAGGGCGSCRMLIQEMLDLHAGPGP